MEASDPSPFTTLPVHGFVLAGGKSSRMGRDKALLPFRGRPMVEIAVEKLRALCSAVSIVGDRHDLAAFAPIVVDERVNCGPGAGIEAGLHACSQPWAVFMPVDVPLLPPEFLQRWMQEALRVRMSVSYLGLLGLGKQPAFCMLQRERVVAFSRRLDSGERRLEVLLNLCAADDGYASWMYDEWELYGGVCGVPGEQIPDEVTLAQWFANVNTPDELARAEVQY